MKQCAAAILGCVIALTAAACGDSPTSPSQSGRLIVRLSASSLPGGATLYLDNSISEAACGASLRVPSGRAAAMAVTPSEVPLATRFHVDENGDTTMRIGLNTEQSVRLNGNGSYTFAPTVAVLSVS